MTSSRKRSLLKACGLALAALVLVGLFLVHMALIHEGPDREGGTDFDTFYASAQHVLSGENPYLLLPGRGLFDDRIRDRRSVEGPAGPILSNLNPPSFVAMSAPLAALPHRLAFAVLQGLTLLSLVMAVPLVVRSVERETGRSSVWHHPLLLIALLAYPPTLASVAYGQLGALLILPLAMAWWAWARGREHTVGIVLGFAASIKLFCGLFLVPLLVARRWKGLAAFVLTVSLLALVGLVMLGPEANGTFLTTLGKVSWMDDPRNGSLAGVAARLGVPRALELTAATLVLLVLVLAVERGRKDATRSGGLIVGVTAAAMLVLSPLAWHYYLPILVLPAVAIWYHAGWTERVLVAVGLASASIRPPAPADDGGPPVDPTLLEALEPRFLGLLLIFVLGCLTLIRPREPRRAPEGREAIEAAPAAPANLFEVPR